MHKNERRCFFYSTVFVLKPYFQTFTHKFKNCTHKISQTHLNTFTIILMPARLLCVAERVPCAMLHIKCFMKLKVWELVSGFADLVSVWVTAFRNCVTRNDLVCKLLKNSVTAGVSFSLTSAALYILTKILKLKTRSSQELAPSIQGYRSCFAGEQCDCVG